MIAGQITYKEPMTLEHCDKCEGRLSVDLRNGICS